MMSLDGYICGPNGELDWHHVDNEFNEYAKELLADAGTLLFGRITYQLMASYWPTSTTSDPNVSYISERMNHLPKVIFTRTLTRADWKNTKIAKVELKAEIAKLKKTQGKDIVILGSGTIVSALTQLGLIDEYRILVNPVVLGSGKSMFKNLKERLNLKLVRSKVFDSGLVALYYKPERKGVKK